MGEITIASAKATNGGSPTGFCTHLRRNLLKAGTSLTGFSALAQTLAIFHFSSYSGGNFLYRLPRLVLLAQLTQELFHLAFPRSAAAYKVGVHEAKDEYPSAASH